MKLYHTHLQELAEIAAKSALEAGEYIAGQRSVHHNRIQKKGRNSEASQIVTSIDYKSQEIILSHLLSTCAPFDLGLLTEEEREDSTLEGSRLVKDYFWCVDPLDGTLPFVEGSKGYAVSIALVNKQGESVLGVVYDPVTNTLYEAIKGLHCLKNGKKWKLKKLQEGGDFLFASNRSFQKLPSYEPMKKTIYMFAKSLGYRNVVERQFGGAVMNAIWTIEEAPGCYVALPKKQDGGGSIWDFAATSCIFNELGISATDCNGNPLLLNDTETTFMNKQGVVFASSKEIKKSLLQNINTALTL
ncbi:MAG: fructose-1,6-bisphosphatase/inositol monophosphatase family enzyme [Saprospiraceae bacterium]|jgi:fructose-1,6-bisphosphatase/inositol monophosphatase family enzyme